MISDPLQTCITCKQPLPISEFCPSSKKCRNCRREYTKKYRESRPGARKEEHQKYYHKNKARIQTYTQTEHYRQLRNLWHKEYRTRPDVKERMTKNYKAFFLKVWKEAFVFFGPCACCGENELEFLSLDHINGNGAEERGRGISGIQILERLRREGWPEEAKKEYRLLCYNCNFTIGHYGYCPHHPERKYPYYYDKRNRGFTENV